MSIIIVVDDFFLFRLSSSGGCVYYLKRQRTCWPLFLHCNVWWHHPHHVELKNQHHYCHHYHHHHHQHHHYHHNQMIKIVVCLWIRRPSGVKSRWIASSKALYGMLQCHTWLLQVEEIIIIIINITVAAGWFIDKIRSSSSCLFAYARDGSVCSPSAF